MASLCEDSEVLLKPGDCLALHYSAVDAARLEHLNRTGMDISMFQVESRS